MAIVNKGRCMPPQGIVNDEDEQEKLPQDYSTPFRRPAALTIPPTIPIRRPILTSIHTNITTKAFPAPTRLMIPAAKAF
jgi:hypothetical protein